MDDYVLESFIHTCDDMSIVEEGIGDAIVSGFKTAIHAIRVLFEKIIIAVKDASARVTAFIQSNKAKISAFSLKNRYITNMYKKIEEYNIKDLNVATEATSLAQYQDVKFKLEKKFKVVSKIEITAQDFLMKMYNAYDSLLDDYNKDIDKCINEIYKAMRDPNYSIEEDKSFEVALNAVGSAYLDSNKDFNALVTKMEKEKPETISDFMRYSKDVINIVCKNFKELGVAYSSATKSPNASAMANELVEFANSLGSLCSMITDKDIIMAKSELLKITASIGIGAINPFKHVQRSIELGLLIKDTGVYAIKFTKASNKALDALKRIEQVVDTKKINNPDEVRSLLKKLNTYASLSPKKYADMLVNILKGSTPKIIDMDYILVKDK